MSERRLQAVVERMIDLLRQENDNLRAGRIADELVGRKLLAENELRRHVVGGIVPEGEESIAVLGQLAAVVRENCGLWAAHREATRKLVSLVIDAVSSVDQEGTYSAFSRVRQQ